MKNQSSLHLLLALASLAFVVGGCGAPRQHVSGVRYVTVPLIVEQHRPFVDVTFRKADGSTRNARFLVDSGGGSFLMVEPLARELGLTWGSTQREGGTDFGRPTVIPVALVGSLVLGLDPGRVFVMVGRDNVLPSAAIAHAEGMIPGHVLARYHVVFDYPRATLTLAAPGALQPQGAGIAMPVSEQSGFPRTEIQVDGVRHGFLIDTGASFTMVSEVLLETLAGAHADWQRHPGGYGEAATLGGQTLETLFIPSAQWGQIALGEFGVVSQNEGTFEKWMSSMMSSPIEGSLAGNVLEHYRVELDYPNQMLYVSGP